ncbi:MAG TPA: hypothetical protein VMH92_09820 [Acidocella sp.]|nr:hypothetical protein [Acidocella sp.]
MKRLLQDCRSVAAMEFAINSFVYMLFLLVLIGLGDLAFIFSGMSYAAQAAARAAAVQTGVTLASGGTSCANAGQVASLMRGILPGLLPAASATAAPGRIQVQTSWVNNASTNVVSGTYLQVTATYVWTPPAGPFSFSLPLGTSATATVGGTSGTEVTSCG